MIVFRFATEQYSHDISGEGAGMFGGRWNSIGLPVVYTSLAISLSLLEILIYSASYDQLRNNILVRIEVPDTTTPIISETALPKRWQSEKEHCRRIGNEFLTKKKTLLLKVPSAIIPEEYNILINPLHPDFKQVKITSADKFEFDGSVLNKKIQYVFYEGWLINILWCWKNPKNLQAIVLRIFADIYGPLCTPLLT